MIQDVVQSILKDSIFKVQSILKDHNFKILFFRETKRFFSEKPSKLKNLT